MTLTDPYQYKVSLWVSYYILTLNDSIIAAIEVKR